MTHKLSFDEIRRRNQASEVYQRDEELGFSAENTIRWQALRDAASYLRRKSTKWNGGSYKMAAQLLEDKSPDVLRGEPIDSGDDR